VAWLAVEEGVWHSDEDALLAAGTLIVDGAASVRAVPGRLSALSVFLCKSVLYGAFVWARRALNSRKRRFPARAVAAGPIPGGGLPGAHRGDAHGRADARGRRLHQGAAAGLRTGGLRGGAGVGARGAGGRGPGLPRSRGAAGGRGLARVRARRRAARAGAGLRGGADGAGGGRGALPRGARRRVPPGPA
jgi:hypothetical protein